MKSPFPGMNPWLEGYIWPDVHNHLARIFTELLAHQIAPKYVARIAVTMYMDYDPESEIGITYPDVELLRRGNIAKEPAVAYGNRKTTEPTIISPFKLPIEQKVISVEVRDVEHNKLVTAIEILSPINKRKPNLIDYREKINKLHKSGVHVLEIDLLRRGTRPYAHAKSDKHYQMMLLRAKTNKAAVWAVGIQDELPVLPVPLLAPDPDVALDLGQALNIIFERSLYHLSIDYKKDPAPPTFSEEDLAWIQTIVAGEKVE
jgi:Protein of unknown function (DUF4058)